MLKDHFNPDLHCEQRYSVKQLLFEILRAARLILKALTFVTAVKVSVDEDKMNAPFAGNTLGFTATTTPADSPVIASQVGWTSSDPTNAPVTPVVSDSTGLTASIVLGTGVTVGQLVDVTCTVTNADGTSASGSASFTVIAPDVTAVSVAQTS